MLRFAPEPTIRRRDAIVAAESDCCAFLTFEVSEDEEAIAVTVTAPDGAEPIMHELTDLFGADAEPGA